MNSSNCVVDDVFAFVKEALSGLVSLRRDAESLVRSAAAKYGGLTEEQIRELVRTVIRDETSLVLIGMPTAGKTTLAGLVCEMTGRGVIETDDVVAAMLGTSIRECFETKGETYFRDRETEAVRSIRRKRGMIISCGGGVIKRPENMEILAENGRIVWIDRNVDKLFPSDSRPLSSSREAVLKLYEERHALYEKYSDIRIPNDRTPEDAAEAIVRYMNSGEY